MAQPNSHKIILARINWDGNGSWWLEIDRETGSMSALNSETPDVKHTLNIVRDRFLVASQIREQLHFPSVEMKALYEAFVGVLKTRLERNTNAD